MVRRLGSLEAARQPERPQRESERVATVGTTGDPSDKARRRMGLSEKSLLPLGKEIAYQLALANLNGEQPDKSVKILRHAGLQRAAQLRARRQALESLAEGSQPDDTFGGAVDQSGKGGLSNPVAPITSANAASANTSAETGPDVKPRPGLKRLRNVLQPGRLDRLKEAVDKQSNGRDSSQPGSNAIARNSDQYGEITIGMSVPGKSELSNPVAPITSANTASANTSAEKNQNVQHQPGSNAIARNNDQYGEITIRMSVPVASLSRDLRPSSTRYDDRPGDRSPSRGR